MIEAQPIIHASFKGMVTSTPPLYLTESESPDNQNVLTDEVYGVIKKLPGFVKTGQIGSKLLVDSCESAWTPNAEVTATADSTTTVIGTNASKLVIGVNFTTGIAAYSVVSAMNLSTHSSIGFYFKSTTALTAGQYEFVLGENVDHATTVENIDIPAIDANTWYYINLSYAGSTASRDAIIWVGLNVVTDIGANTVYIDHIESFSTSFFPVEMCETAWTASSNVTSTADNTSGFVKQGTYSSKNVIAAGFTTGLISHSDITALNLSEFKRIGLWVYSTIDLLSGDLSIQLSDAVGLEEDMLITEPIIASTWTYVTVAMAVPADNTAITIVGLNSNRDFGACTIYTDDIRALKPVKTAAEYFQTDGSRKLMIADGETVWASTDGVTFSAVASGFNPDYDHEFCTYDGDCYFTNGFNWVMAYTDAEKTIVYNGAADAAFYIPKARHIWNHQGATLMAGYSGGNLATVSYTDESKLTSEAGWFSTSASYNKDLALDTGDYITRGFPYGERTVIFLNRIFYVLTGDQYNNFDWMPRELGIGCTLGRSVQIKDGNILFAGSNGLYRMDESFSPVRISDPIKEKYQTFQQGLVNYLNWNQSIQEDFAAGTIGSNQFEYTGTYSGILQLKNSTILTDLAAGLTPTTNASTTNITNITDGNDSTSWVSGGFTATEKYVVVDLSSNKTIKYARLSFSLITNISGYTEDVLLQYSTDNTNWTTFKTMSTNGIHIYSDATGFSARYIRVFKATATFGENRLYIYTLNTASCNSTVTSTYFTMYTDTIDYGAIPTTFGNLTINSSFLPAQTTLKIYASTSADGTSWDADVYIGTTTTTGNYSFNIGSISTPFTAPTLKRYIKIGLRYLIAENISNTSSLYIGGTFISQTNNTGGSIAQWGTFDTSTVLSNQTINFYTRSATTEGGLTTATWNIVTAGQRVPEPIGNGWIQWKAEFNTTMYNEIPYIDSVTVNWVTSTASTIPSTQMASIVDNNRYFMFGQTASEEYNNTGICIDKMWQFQGVKDYPVGCATLFNQEPWFGSAIDGRIFRLFTGVKFDYIDWQDDIVSYWVTGRFGMVHKGQDKWFIEMISFFEPQSSVGTLDVQYDMNNSGTFTTIGSVDLTEGDGEKRFLFTGFVKGRDGRFKFYCDDPCDLAIYKLVTVYQIFERTI